MTSSAEARTGSPGVTRTNGSEPRWQDPDVPRLLGRTAVVTGSSQGIGFETARVLAARGARVLLACRSLDQAEQAAARIRRMHPDAAVEVCRLDLAAMPCVTATASELHSRCEKIDLLINNAGIMEPPYTRTVDGFELTFATNHLGHFALTGLLLDRLLATPGSRIVTVSSEGHARGEIDFADLQSEDGYDAERAYCQSKLANVMFTYELERRLRAAGANTAALACHPGIVRTRLYRTRSILERALLSPRLRVVTSRWAQDVRMGALPTLRAATDPRAEGGTFYGPAGNGRIGYPTQVSSSVRSYDVATQRRLWRESEQLTRVTYPI